MSKNNKFISKIGNFFYKVGTKLQEDDSLNAKDTPFLRELCFNSKTVEEYFWKSSQLGNNDKKYSINELLPVIRLFVSQNNIKTAAEFGTAQCRVSSALLLGGIKKLFSVDIVKDKAVDHFETLCIEESFEFEFNLIDSAKYDLPKVDLLFIDSLHNRDHLKKELQNHNKVDRFIMLHDTETFKEEGDKGDGLQYEVEDFLNNNNNWKIKYQFVHNNGMTVLEKSN
jgi:hypothetical protein|tara:strand:- start:8320 stop:8997 length:678 start_codon:yes stop_codon:yes gene_type:complete